MNNKPQQGQQLQIEVAPDMATGQYSNFALIAHTHAESVLDLASVMPGISKAQVVSRVIMAPEHAKRLAMALQENVMRYEQEFGKIQLDNVPKQAMSGPKTANPFGGSQGEA
jgi:hypothetical protein